MSHDSSQFHPHAAHEPTPPIGGYRRAVPRDALTGEPIRSDTLHIHVRPPLDRQSHDHSPITPVRHPHRQRTCVTSIATAVSSEPLPVLRLDDLLDYADADVDDQEVADA